MLEDLGHIVMVVTRNHHYLKFSMLLLLNFVTE